MKKMTIIDVAKRANVSKSTVSQYLNKRYDYMSEKTLKRIEEAIKELNYQPNIVARSLKQKATFTVGVIVANILHSFSTHIIRAIENFFNDQGFHIIVCNADDEPGKEKQYIQMLRAKQVDGIIIFPTGVNLDLYQHMIQDKFPIVFMDRTIEDLDIATVMLDNHLAAKLAVDHFIEKGYDRIAILTTSIIRNISPRVERIEGYEAALESHGVKIRKEYIKTADQTMFSSVLEELFSLDKPPAALLAGNDIVLDETLKYISDRGLRIPEDVAVIGIDDVPYASFYTPPITTVSQPVLEMAKQAVDLLLDQMKEKDQNNKAASVIRMSPSLIERKSC
ncbi:LacI family DNA-binding transcriptional regulator [Peribacillus kribbensis]|uniref:LacI family DNA-binding transcriptional regulator n=1 Tax=Peribacillus kribbensis TaxID=356658 RepID=UPI0004258068|nr:substrate-binding domain-containing protein [Peribacillus kribbensis]